MDDQLRIVAELARDAADAISAWQAREPDFGGDDEAWGSYEEALTALAAAYYQTTHSGLGLVSGELLAAALPSLAMRQWDAAAELAKTGAAYAEAEAKHIARGGEMYGYANTENSLAAHGIVNWYAPDIAAETLSDLATHASAAAQVAYDQWIMLPGEAEQRILRVVTLEDGETIHNAFPDSNFLRKWRRSR